MTQSTPLSHNGAAVPAACSLQRLKKRAQFLELEHRGKVLAKTPHFALHFMRLEQELASSEQTEAEVGAAKNSHFKKTAPAFYYGAIVPKRWAKAAVRRNLVKRQIYSVVHQELEPYASQFAGVWVVRLRAAFGAPQFISAASEVLKKAVRHELKQLFETGFKRC